MGAFCPLTLSRAPPTAFLGTKSGEDHYERVIRLPSARSSAFLALPPFFYDVYVLCTGWKVQDLAPGVPIRSPLRSRRSFAFARNPQLLGTHLNYILRSDLSDNRLSKSNRFCSATLPLLPPQQPFHRASTVGNGRSASTPL